MKIGTKKWSSISNKKPTLDSQLDHLDLHEFSQVTQPLFPHWCNGGNDGAYLSQCHPSAVRFNIFEMLGTTPGRY